MLGLPLRICSLIMDSFFTSVESPAPRFRAPKLAPMKSLTYIHPLFLVVEGPCYCFKLRVSKVYPRPGYSGLSRVRIGSFYLKSNSPFDQGLEIMVSTFIPHTAGMYIVTSPEVAHFQDTSDF